MHHFPGKWAPKSSSWRGIERTRPIYTILLTVIKKDQSDDMMHMGETHPSDFEEFKTRKRKIAFIFLGSR